MLIILVMNILILVFEVVRNWRLFFSSRHDLLRPILCKHIYTQTRNKKRKIYVINRIA